MWYGSCMSWFSKQKKLVPVVSGAQLVADFHSALLNLVTMDVAQAEAKRSEANVTEALQYATSARNGVYITPGDIAPNTADYLVQNSLDAHLKKVQAEQIQSFTLDQVEQLQAETVSKYKGRKVRVTRLDDTKGIFVPLWADSQTGELRRGNYNGKTIVGTVEDVSFEQNALVLKPTFSARTLNPGRKYFLVEVISMETLEPAVKIELA